MYRTNRTLDPTQGCEPSSICERVSDQGPVARQISRKSSGKASDDQADPSEEDQDAAGREGLFGKLQSRLSLSLSRLGSIEPAQNPFKRRKSSLESNLSAAAVAENADGQYAENNSPALNALMPFVPLMFRRDLLLPEPTFSAMQEPRMQTHQGAVMIADITGFTALTEDLGRRGAAGVELLTRCMNNFFTLVIELVYLHGGDVMRFAGDSVICAFLPSVEEAELEDGGLAAATQRSVKCAAVLAHDLGSMRMLMDGRVVALPDEDRRLMRAAATAKRAQQDAVFDAQCISQERPQARRLHRATADAQTCALTRGFASTTALSDMDQPASPGSLNQRDRLTKRERSRSATQNDDVLRRTIDAEVDAEAPPQSHLPTRAHSYAGTYGSSAGLKSVVRKVSATSKSLGGLLISFSRTFSTDEISPKGAKASQSEAGLKASSSGRAAVRQASFHESVNFPGNSPPTPRLRRATFASSAESRSVRSSSHSESRLRHLISVGVRRRRTAGDVPDQLPRHADKHGTGRSVGLGLRQRLWSEGNAISRSHSRFGTPRRTDSTSRLGPQLFGLKLSELARRPLIGKPDQARLQHNLLVGSAPVSAEHSVAQSLQNSPKAPPILALLPKDAATSAAATLMDVGKQTSFGRKARAQAPQGESQPLDAFFKAQSIAAHRPPHIPAMRMLLNMAIQETAEPPAFAARMPHLPAIQTIPERSSSGATDEVADCHRLTSVLHSFPPSTSQQPAFQKELNAMVRQRLRSMGAAGQLDAKSVSLDAAEDRDLRTKLRALFKDSVNVRRAERVATAKAAIRAEFARQQLEGQSTTDLLRELGTVDEGLGIQEALSDATSMNPTRETPILCSASVGRQPDRSLGKTGLSQNRATAQADSSVPKTEQGRAPAAWPQSQAPVSGSDLSSMRPNPSKANSAHPFDQAPSLAGSRTARKGHCRVIAAAARPHPEFPATSSNPFAMYADSSNTTAAGGFTSSTHEKNRIAGGRMQDPGAAPISLLGPRSPAKNRNAKEQEHSFAPPGSAEAWPKPIDDSPPLTRHVSSSSLKQERSRQPVQHNFSHAASTDDRLAPALLLKPRKREQSCSSQASSESRGPVIVLPPGPLAESRESEADAVYRLSAAAASQADTSLAARQQGREHNYPSQASPESACPLMMLPPGPVAESKESDADAALRLCSAAASQAEAPLAAREQSREQKNSLQAFIGSRGPVTILPPVPVAESKESAADTAYRLSAAAAFQAEAYPSAPKDAACIVVKDTSGIPGNKISISMVAPKTSSEIPRSGMAVSDKSRSCVLTSSEQKPRGSRESARGSVRWRSFRDSFWEGGDQFKKRRWSLLLMGKYREDRRISLPMRRVQKRLTNDVTLRDRRWSSIFVKAVLPQRQDPFSVASQLEAGSKLSYAPQSNHSKSSAKAQQLRNTHTLSLKVAVGCGSICTFHVGGAPDCETSGSRWEFFIGDRPHCTSVSIGDSDASERQPMDQISSIEHFLDPGEVAISTEVAQQVQGLWEVQPLPWSGYRLTSLQGPPEVPGTETAPSGEVEDVQHKGISRAVVERAEDVLRAHLPDAVSKRIEAGLIDFISEIRVCTILFIGFPSLKATNPFSNGSSDVASIQAAIMAVQKCMQQHSGSFLQFRCDEKGFLSICAFGLPGRTHEDDPCRGVRAALDLVEALRFLKGEAIVGVTTGQLLCACVGSATRSEYTVYGNAINLSARLMMKAAAGAGCVLCDSTTYQLASKAAAFNCLKPLEVKGKRHPVAVYEALSPLAAEQLPDRRQLRARAPLDNFATPYDIMRGPSSLHGAPVDLQTPLIGADYMMTQVNERVAFLVESSEGGCILVEGEAGMGKSRLLEEVQRSDLDGKGESVTVIRAAASTAYRSQVMYPWRRVFKSLFAHDRSRGHVYTLREKDTKGRPIEVTKLGIRLHECGCEWQEWRKSLAVLLEVLEDEMPVLPPRKISTAEDAIPGGAPLRNAEPADSGGVPIQLGYPSKSVPTTVATPMLAGTAKTIAIPAPSVGSPFAAYAEALPEDAVTLAQVKGSDGASLTRSLSEGTAQGFHESFRTSLDIKTTERMHDGAASVPIDPANFLRARSGRMISRLSSRMRQYASGVRHQKPTAAASSDPDEVAKMPGLWLCPSAKSAKSAKSSGEASHQRPPKTLISRAKSASPWLRRGARGVNPNQAVTRAHAMTSMLLKPQSSLASLASSIRSEEQNKRAMSRQMPSAMRPSYQGLDSELLSLCQQSARSRHTSRDSHPSSDFSLVNFMPQNSTSTHSNSQPGQLGSPGGLGSPHMSRKRTSSSDLRRCSFDNASLRLSVSQTSQADGRSPFAPGAKPPFPLAMSRASSAEIQIRPAAIPMRAPSEGHNTPALTMTRAQSGPLPMQPGRSDADSHGKGGQVLQGRRRTRQRSEDSSTLMSLGSGRSSRQPLIAIRSGEVELFMRHQPLRAAPTLPESVPEQGISPHSSGEISLISGFASKAIPGNEKDELRGETASDAGLPLKGKRRLSAALNPFRRRDSIELALSPSAAVRESRTKIAANFSLYKAHTTALPAIGKKGSPPADLDTLCDAAIANIQAFQPEPASASMLPGTSSVKVGQQIRGFFTGRNSLALNRQVSTDVNPAAIGAQGRQGSAPQCLPEAEGMLSKAALQDLRKQALARIATSKAWQEEEKEEHPTALTKHTAASTPLQNIKNAPWDPDRLQTLRVKSSSLAYNTATRSAARGSQEAARKPHVPPEMRALKLQELLITLLREWTAAYGPLLLLLDDFDRADALSWSFLARAAEEVDMAVLVVAAIRPNDGIFATPTIGQVAKTAVHTKVTALCQDIRENPFTLRLIMQPFTPEQTHTFLSAALDGVQVSAEVARNLWEKTGGLPLYIEQMVVYMQQQQQQHGAEGVEAQDDLSAFIRSTVTIHSIITDRIDKLQPSQQLTLKIASVMGMSVSVDLLQATYPIAATAKALEKDLLELERANFLRPTDVPGTWLMTQVLARDVAYELIPFSQRRSLHAQLAKALESDVSSYQVPPSIVAYHWTHSCAGAEATHWRRALHAVDWWEKAAQTAVEEGIDPAEAIGLFQRSDEIAGVLKAAFRATSGAIHMPQGNNQSFKSSFWSRRAAQSAHSGLSSSSSHAAGGVDWSSRVVHPVRRALWQRCMASLHLAQGDLDMARHHGLQALHYMGAPLPSEEPEQAQFFAHCLFLMPGACVGRWTLQGGQRVSNDGSSASEGSTFNDMAAWIADSLQWPGQENDGEQPSNDIDWQLRKPQEAAVVLELLVNASLMLQPVDIDALRYVWKTAKLLQGIKFGRRFPKDSPLFAVVQKCRSVQSKAHPRRRATGWSGVS